MKKLIKGLIMATVGLLALPQAFTVTAYGQTANQKRLVSYSSCDAGSPSTDVIKYDPNGRVSEILSVGARTVYDWSGYSRGQVKGVFTSATSTLNEMFTLDAKGRVVKAEVSNDKGLLSTTEFGYDAAGRLVSVKDSGDKEKLREMYKSPSVAKFIYENGALRHVNVSYTVAGLDGNALYKSSEKIANKGGWMMVMQLIPEITTFSIMEDLAILNLLGTPVAELPTSVTYVTDDDGGYSQDLKIKWTLDSDGYPQRMNVNSEATTFIWE